MHVLVTNSCIAVHVLTIYLEFVVVSTIRLEPLTCTPALYKLCSLSLFWLCFFCSTFFFSSLSPPRPVISLCQIQILVPNLITLLTTSPNRGGRQYCMRPTCIKEQVHNAVFLTLFHTCFTMCGSFHVRV